MDVDIDDEGAHYIQWDFRPYEPVRPYNTEKNWHLRENVFVRCWQKHMTRHALYTVTDNAIMCEDQYFVENEGRRYPVLKIFDGIIPSVHQTRIASNFILFLGKGNGRSYLEEAEKLSDIFEKTLHSKPDAYLAQWAFANNPWAGSSGGWQTTNNPPRYDFTQTDQMDAFFAPDYQDIKVLERMACWCGTNEGQDFLQKAEKLTRYLDRRWNRPEKMQERMETRKRKIFDSLTR